MRTATILLSFLVSGLIVGWLIWLFCAAILAPIHGGNLYKGPAGHRKEFDDSSY